MTRRTRFTPLSFGIALMLCAFSALADTPTTALVTTAPVTERNVARTLHAFGVIDADPDQVLSLSLSHAGIIGRVWVQLGQRVRGGDRLLEIITSPDAHRQYLQAQSAVDYARRELQRQQRLLNEQLATQAQVDSATKNLSDARAALQALRKQGQNRDRKFMRAPRDGIVTRLDVSSGQRVPADTTALQLAEGRHLIARLGVEPEDLAAITIGSEVLINQIFVPGTPIRASVRSVHAMVDPTTHLVEVLADIPPDRSAQLVLGNRVTATFQLTAHKALVVPRSAVLSDTDGAYVFTVTQGRAHRIAVTTGVDTGEVIEIAGNLKAGDKVVTRGNYELEDNMAVREHH